MLRIVITNFNKRFTGVSATINTLYPLLAGRFDIRFVGSPLPSCPPPVSYREALAFSKGRAIWHVRRNAEMNAALFARDILRKPIRIVFTSAAQRRHSAIPRWLIARMDGVIATTQEAARFVPHVRAVIPHGVDTARFTPATNREEAWRGLGFGGRASIAAIGRIRPEKGTDRFVDMAIRLLPANPGLMAVMAGRIASEHQAFADELRGKIKLAGLSDRILFIGERDASTMPELVRGLSLLIAAPRYEGYGLTPLEAMASGVPVIASDAGYFREFIAEGETGYIATDGDPAHMAALAAALLAEPWRLEAMGQAAVIRAATRFSAQAEADAIGDVYESLGSRR
jgi:mannosyltransferase